MIKSKIKIRSVAVLATAMSCTGLAWLARPVEAQTLSIGAPQTIPDTTVLNGVACGLTCHAIGDPVDVSGVGGSNPQALPVPGVVNLSSLACPPAPNNETCYAVGQTAGGENPAVVVSITTGASGDVIGGRPVSIPDTIQLNGITCPTDNTCYAVGQGGGGPIIVTIPVADISKSTHYNPPNESGNTYQAIACPSNSACYVVGSYLDIDGTLDTYAIPNPEQPFTQPLTQKVTAVNAFSAIGCSSSSTCFALGGPVQCGVYTANEVVSITNGTAATTAQPYYAPGVSLNGIACPASETCLIVGSSGSFEDGNLVDVEGFVLPVQFGNLNTSALSSVSGSNQGLSSIACSDQYHCYAVGGNTTYGETPVITQGLVVPVLLAGACPPCLEGEVCEFRPGGPGVCIPGGPRCRVGSYNCNGVCIPENARCQ
jgi:hypothetical protein